MQNITRRVMFPLTDGCSKSQSWDFLWPVFQTGVSRNLGLVCDLTLGSTLLNLDLDLDTWSDYHCMCEPAGLLWVSLFRNLRVSFHAFISANMSRTRTHQ